MRPVDEKGPDDDPKARRVNAAPAVANTAEQTPDEPPSEPGNAFRARIASKGQDPNAPPEAPPTEIADAPSAPARPPEDDDVEALLLGDRGWGPAPTPTPKVPDLSGWIDVPTLPAEARAAWRRRLGFTHERPVDLDPGAGLLRNGAVAWVRAASPWRLVDPIGATLAAVARAPWGPWVGVGRAARLDAARVALTQLALLRSVQPGGPVHLATHAARLDEFERSVRERGGRFPTVSALTRMEGTPVQALQADAWTPAVRAWLDVRTLPAPHAFDDASELDDATRRTLAEQGLRIAREVARLRARAAGIVLLVAAHARPDLGAVAGAVGTVDARTQAILVGLGSLGRGLHHTPPLPTAEARQSLASLTRALDHAADEAARLLSTVVGVFGPPSPPRYTPAQVDATLRRVPRRAPLLTADSAVDAAILVLLGGETPPAVDRAPACLAVIAIDKLASGVTLDAVLAEEGRALVAVGASGAVELILRAV